MFSNELLVGLTWAVQADLGSAGALAARLAVPVLQRDELFGLLAAGASLCGEAALFGLALLAS